VVGAWGSGMVFRLRLDCDWTDKAA